jgi:hypothetical protein
MPTNNVNNAVDAAAGASVNNYYDTGLFDSKNISQDRLCSSRYLQISDHSYILCIPRIDYNVTKMDVARAVENQILTSGFGFNANINNFEYVKHVTFVPAFDEVVFGTLRNSNSCITSSNECYREPWYKIAIVNVDIPPGYSENGVQYYTNGEDAFYSGVCRGDIVINSWTDAFFLAHPRSYFQPSQSTQSTSTQSTQPAQKLTKTKSEATQDKDAAFQKWKYEFKLRQLERKVKKHENTIRQNELDVVQAQNMTNDYAESIRFLTRGYTSDIQGLQSKSLPMTTFISHLNNRYARVCASDTTFLEVNRNMKLKIMNGYAINACDDCDACQELIHSIDDTHAEYRDELFCSIERMICKINKSVQWFEKLHLRAERSLFGLRNRRVLEDFGMYLNTALEIVEEVTSRVAAFTQDLEYARCYGGLFQKQLKDEISYSQGRGYNYDYDYSEDADEVYENEVHGDIVESTKQMLHYFDEQNHELYHEQQEEQEEQEEQPKSPVISTINTSAGVYHEEAVIIEGEENCVNSDAVDVNKPVGVVERGGDITTATTVSQETQQKKRGWLTSWF